MLTLAQINFGAADAVNEAEDDENLLLDGFFDIHDAVEHCLERQHFLVLGYKGSGKSALGQHLTLSADERHLLARTVNLKLLQFSDFPGLLRPGEDWQAKYPAIWTFHLLVQIVDMLNEHLSNTAHGHPAAFADVVDQLRTVGALPAEELPQAIRQFGQRAVALAEHEPGGAGGSIERINTHLVEAIQSIPISPRPILVVDGLDEFLHPSIEDLFVLTALVEATGTVNRALARNLPTSPAKVIVLCRTDLFDRLPGANTAKLREDRSIQLDWYQNTADPERTHLVRLLNQKARVSEPGLVSVAKQYLPKQMNSKPLTTYFLDHTRHTPRDFLRVFRHVQKYAPSSGEMSYKSINQGLRSYSTYFESEIRNEMSGYATEDDIAGILQLLRSMGKVQFTLRDLEDRADAAKLDLDLRKLVTRLFECSAIGLVESDVVFGQGTPRFTFKYRNPNASINLDASFRVHVGWRRRLSVATANAEESGLRLENRPQATRQRRRMRRQPVDGAQRTLPFPEPDDAILPATTPSNIGALVVTSRPRGGATRPAGPPAPKRDPAT